MFQIFDFAEDEFPNTYEGWRQTVHPEDLAKAETDLTEALESLESFHSSFRIIHKSDKSVHYIEAHAHIVRDEDGHAVEVFGVNWDITESKLAEKEREDLQIQRSHSQRLETIGTMAGGLAHDLNNILTPIMGHSDMILEDKSLPDYLREDAEAISTGALRAREIIEKILSFSQKKEKKRGTVFVQALIKEAVSLLKPAIPSRIQLDLDVDGDCPPSLPMPRRSMS